MERPTFTGGERGWGFQFESEPRVGEVAHPPSLSSPAADAGSCWFPGFGVPGLGFLGAGGGQTRVQRAAGAPPWFGIPREKP